MTLLYLMICAMEATKVAKEAMLVLIPRKPASPFPVGLGLLGTTISQPGSILCFPASLTVPF